MNRIGPKIRESRNVAPRGWVWVEGVAFPNGSRGVPGFFLKQSQNVPFRAFYTCNVMWHLYGWSVRRIVRWCPLSVGGSVDVSVGQRSRKHQRIVRLTGPTDMSGGRPDGQWAGH
jgi:hypothetical protein